MSQNYYASGTVSAFCGTSGLLQTILGLVCGTEVSGEVIDATPNGVLTSFSGTLAHKDCGLGRLIVSYTIGAVVYTATDDGSGILTGDHITSGTIVYTSGAWTLVFSTAPDNLTSITASYLYGAPGQDWRLKYSRFSRDATTGNPFGTTAATDPIECVIENTGLTGAEEVLLGIREWRYVAGAGYGWDLNGYTYYTTSMAWNVNSAQHGRTSYNTTWNRWDQMPMLPLTNGTLYWWLFSNRQRIVLVVKVGTGYESMYLGFGRRFSSPTDYPIPMVIKGSCQGLFNYTSAASWRQFICNNEWTQLGYGLMIIDPANTYVICGNASYYSTGIRMLPYNTFDDTAGTVTDTIGATPYNLLSPVLLVRPSVDQVFMDLDGVYHITSDSVLAEDLMYTDTEKLRVFPNITRTTFYDWMGVKVDDITTTTTTTTTSSTTSSSSSSTTTTTTA
jgi:hypothetical protein